MNKIFLRSNPRKKIPQIVQNPHPPQISKNVTDGEHRRDISSKEFRSVARKQFNVLKVTKLQVTLFSFKNNLTFSLNSQSFRSFIQIRLNLGLKRCPSTNNLFPGKMASLILTLSLSLVVLYVNASNTTKQVGPSSELILF